jgi:hypothetical protein
MLEPPPVAATREELVTREVEAIQAELVRVDARIRSLGWGAPSPRRLSVAEQWGAFAGTLDEPDRQEDDGVARTVLYAKRDALLHELERLRARLTGEPGTPRRGRWG